MFTSVNITHESQLRARAYCTQPTANDWWWLWQNLKLKWLLCGLQFIQTRGKTPAVLDQRVQMESSWDLALKDQSPETRSQFTDGKVDPFCQTETWELEPKPRKTIQLSPSLSSGYEGEFSCQSKPWHTLNGSLKRKMVWSLSLQVSLSFTQDIDSTSLTLTMLT